MEPLLKIVRERLRSRAAGEHPGADLLAGFLEQSLRERERERVLEHLSRCAACRQAVTLATPAAGLAAAVAATRAPGEQYPARSGWWGRWTALRWGVAAACVAVLGMAVLVRDLRRAPRTPGPGAPAGSQAAPPAEAQAAPGRNATAVGNAGGLVANGNLSEATPRGRKAQIANGGRKQDGARARDLAMSGEPIAGAVRGGIGTEGKLAKKSRSQFGAGQGGGLGGAGLAGGAAAQSALREEAIAPAEKQAMNRAKLPAALQGMQGPQALLQRRAHAPETNSSGLTTGSARFDTNGNPPIANLTEVAPALAARPSARAGGGAAGIGGVAGAGNGPGANSPRWTLSPEGVLEESVDAGQTWIKFALGSGTKFRAVSALGSEIWAGGASGALFHSSDGGAHWRRVRPTANGAMLTDGIVRIRFVDAQLGLVTTQNGEIWATADGGATWERR